MKSEPGMKTIVITTYYLCPETEDPTELQRDHDDVIKDGMENRFTSQVVLIGDMREIVEIRDEMRRRKQQQP